MNDDDSKDPVFQSVGQYEDSLRPASERLAADREAMRTRLPQPATPAAMPKTKRNGGKK